MKRNERSGAERLLRELVGSNGEAANSAGGGVVKALAWARVSTDMQDERGLSIPEQLREIRNYASSRGIEIVGEFQEAVSAFRKPEKRLEFQRMLQCAKSDPEITAVIVRDLSRFSRDGISSMQITQELLDHGVRVLSLTDPEYDPETPAGVYLRHITAAKNEAYCLEVAMHTRKGCLANIRSRDPKSGWGFKNGGQPILGYVGQRIRRGTNKSGEAIYGSIWVLDETLVAGRPVHEWAHHCLVELAAKGASLDELRDFCNQHGIPPRRGRYWTTSTWNSMLKPSVLLKYCGHEVWDVRRRRGPVRPSSGWQIVENAHPAIITPEEAKAIAEARRKSSRRGFCHTSGRSRSSRYLLSGGLFRCVRCGANMIGHPTSHGSYYVCGSQPYRRGMGCGKGVYVPKEWVEKHVVEGMQELVSACADPKGFTRKVNAELRRIWEASTGHDPKAAKKIATIDRKRENIWKAIEDGLKDVSSANERLAELSAERGKLVVASEVFGEPPRIDAARATAFRKDFPKLLKHATPAEKKELIGAWVEKIRLTPEQQEVSITYRVPEPVVNKLVTGARFKPATLVGAH